MSSTSSDAEKNDAIPHSGSTSPASHHTPKSTTDDIDAQCSIQKHAAPTFIGNIEDNVERQLGHIGEVLRRDLTIDVLVTQKLWDRFRGKGRRRIGIVESFVNVAKSSSEY